MKRAANLYSARTYAIAAPREATNAWPRIARWIPHIPNYVWLAMIVLTVSALSVSTYMRAQEMERDAKSSHAFTATKVDNLKAFNSELKKQTQRIKQDPQAAQQAAQEQLRVLRPNEIVVAVRDKK